jgi:hypothetical protein
VRHAAAGVDRHVLLAHLPLLAHLAHQLRVRQDRQVADAVADVAGGVAPLAIAEADGRLLEAEHVDVEADHRVAVGHGRGDVVDRREGAITRRDAEVPGGEADGIAVGIEGAVLAVLEIAAFLLQLDAGGELLQPRLDLADVVDAEAEVVRARAVVGLAEVRPALQERQVEEPVGHGDVAGGRAPQHAQAEVSLVEVGEGVRLLADNCQIAQVRVGHRAPPFLLDCQARASVQGRGPDDARLRRRWCQARLRGSRRPPALRRAPEVATLDPPQDASRMRRAVRRGEEVGGWPRAIGQSTSGACCGRRSCARRAPPTTRGG